jgi:CRISPR/Cas system CMR-associated protein Cmr3 (group 5 of RAMP superfamily)
MGKKPVQGKINTHIYTFTQNNKYIKIKMKKLSNFKMLIITPPPLHKKGMHIEYQKNILKKITVIH